MNCNTNWLWCQSQETVPILWKFYEGNQSRFFFLVSLSLIVLVLDLFLEGDDFDGRGK